MEQPKDPAKTDPKNPSGEPGKTPPAPAPVEPVVPEPSAPKSDEPGQGDPNRKLQSQRDKLQNEVHQMQAFMEPILVERTTTDFLKRNAEKYPDVTVDDLKDVADLSHDYLDTYAGRLQTRFQEVSQKRIDAIENPEPQKMSLSEKNAELDKLRKSKEPGRFQKMLRIQQAA